MAKGWMFWIVLQKLKRRWEPVLVISVLAIVFFVPRLFADPETIFVETFNTDLPKDGKGRLIEYETSKRSSMFVFEGNYDFLRALERQVLPRWEQIEGCKPDDVFKVPGLIRKHELFADSAEKLHWVYVGKTSGAMDSDQVVFCTDLSSRAWVVSMRMGGGLTGVLNILNTLFWVVLVVYLVRRYWSPQDNAAVSAESA